MKTFFSIILVGLYLQTAFADNYDKVKLTVQLDCFVGVLQLVDINIQVIQEVDYLHSPSSIA